MSDTVYQDRPNVVEIVVKDDTGEQSRFVAGESVDEVVARLFGEPVAIAALKKERKPRRTKAEIAAAKPAEVMPAKDKTWP